ncbi:aspartate aminotransferase family protein [Verrucomicrobiaceae bacterium N1E253]|uniref:Aspartate aminotransferase family protein n=1 Tax=Oceaniferula marina TaxID=2748318 RepID=A0A851GEB7_9BACT|nr:aspartate aminotransferase family protein [Oceaniferula marina]NWK54051.1 aspartate aminotransferase family protein [Oceaniferula marina]
MLPELITEIPGPASVALAEELRRYESHNVTYVDEAWPVFWKRAEGVNVWDEDGNRFLDMTAAFGVAGLGHGWSAPAMVEQSQVLVHGMGDVHPTRLKVETCQMLSALTYERWGAGRGKVVLSNSGFEAVESAMKTARVVTGRAGVLSFANSYHGMGYGALLGSGFEKFRQPFEDQLAARRVSLAFPRDDAGMERFEEALAGVDASGIGLVLVEPIQGRGGKIVPPDAFLPMLRSWCDQHGVLLACDEIFTGFNRTGRLFACEWSGVVPDLICVGKSMSGGFPISACVGKAEIMDAWPVSSGEALHTSTFLGNPVGCAMSVMSMKEHARAELAESVQGIGDYLKARLHGLRSPLIRDVRGRGLMLGVELAHQDGSPASDVAGGILGEMMQDGVFMLADGPAGNVLAWTPPFGVNREEVDYVLACLQARLEHHGGISA